MSRIVRVLQLLLIAACSVPDMSIAKDFVQFGVVYQAVEVPTGTHSGEWDLQYKVNGEYVRYSHGSITYLRDGFAETLLGPAQRVEGVWYLPVTYVAEDSAEITSLREPVQLAPIAPAPATGALQLLSPVKIFIDPGHGGTDAGASANGLREKDVTLSVSKAMAQALASRKNVEIKLSRADDTYPTLNQRTRAAEAWGADYFVSIHCNSAPRKSASGAEVFIVGELSTDKQAERLAGYENAFFAEDEDRTDDIVSILADLQQQGSTTVSSRVAKSVSSVLMSRWGGEQRGVRQAPFWVLRNASMPSILIELGFISNTHEAEKLANPIVQSAYGSMLADAMYAAVISLQSTGQLE